MLASEAISTMLDFLHSGRLFAEVPGIYSTPGLHRSGSSIVATIIDVQVCTTGSVYSMTNNRSFVHHNSWLSEKLNSAWRGWRV